MISRGPAPIARRIPISRVRWLTVYAITPYVPIAASSVADEHHGVPKLRHRVAHVRIDSARGGKRPVRLHFSDGSSRRGDERRRVAGRAQQERHVAGQIRPWRPVSCRLLKKRRVDDRLRILRMPGRDVAHDADDFACLLFGHDVEREVLADWVLARPEAPGRGLVHDRAPRGVGDVAAGELASPYDWRADRGKQIRRDDEVGG
jgi:hypothetical protein